jgi:diacylglycerol kinase family enzyme
MPKPAGISVIINARSGKAASADAGGEIQAAFAKAGTQVRIERVYNPGDLPARARQAAGRGDLLVAAGGDGTIGAVAGVAVESRSTMGVLPMGTLNHFAKDLGLPLDLEKAAAAIVAGRTRDVDVGDVNGRIFVNNSSLGIYPRMLWERRAEQRRGRGKWTAFTIAMSRTWRDYRTLVVRLSIHGVERAVRTPFVFVGNNEYKVEGVELGGRSALTGGLLSVFVAPECGRFEILTLPIRALGNRLTPDAPFEGFLTESLSVELPARRVNVALDGEVAVMCPSLRYRVRPGALRVLVPGPAEEP